MILFGDYRNRGLMIIEERVCTSIIRNSLKFFERILLTSILIEYIFVSGKRNYTQTMDGGSLSEAQT